MNPFGYVRAESLEHAAALLARDPDGTRLLAGGTDLLVWLADGKLRPGLLVDPKHLAGLDGVAADGELRLGSLVRMRDLERHAAVRARWTALAEGAAEVGGVAIRNRATIGGNLATASPAADTPPALLALGAEVEATGVAGSRRLALDGFFTGPGRHVLARDEILTAIRLPAAPPRSGSAYLKLATRKAMDIAFVGVATAVTLDQDGTVLAARAGLGAVAPTPRAVDLTAALTGRRLDEAALDDAADVAMAAADPIDDKRCSARYRRAMVGELTRRTLRQAAARAEG